MEKVIANTRRHKQMEEFWDKDHEVAGEYYNLLEKRTPEKKLKEEMEKIIQKDPDFYDSYIIVADILKRGGKIQEARELLYSAYGRALQRIVDKEGNFPKRI